MRKVICFFFLATLIVPVLPAQGRLVLSGDAYIVIDNAAQLVIDNPNPNAVTTAIGGGNIVSESENDLIRWNIGNGAGPYIIPWTTASNVKIPLTVSITSAGTGSGFFRFSTHTDNDAINSWDNFDYRPSDVTNMGGPAIPNNSASVIDRFWRIEQTGYTTAPQATLQFRYSDTERSQVGNTIPAGTMFAQRFDVGQNRWLLPGTGFDNFPIPSVTAAAANSNFFKSWTLSTQNVPLATGEIDLLARMEGEAVRLDWFVEKAVPGDQFVVLRSANGTDFVDLGTVSREPGALAFQKVDEEPAPGLNYYQIRLADGGGHGRYSEIRAVFLGNHRIRVFPSPSDGDQLELQAEGLKGEKLGLRLSDLCGRLIFDQVWEPEEALGRLSLLTGRGLAKGIYLLKVQGEAWQETIRIVIR